MENRTEISDLGEFGLIDHLTRNFETYNVSTIESVGDDAAVMDHFGKQTVMTTDLLIEGIHFDLMYTPLKHLGYKSVIVNLSDVYAMNAQPTQITVSLGITNRFSVEALAEFYEGVYAACEKYKVDLVGGDTSSSQKGFIISVTAIGEVAPDQYIKRSTAKKRRFNLCLRRPRRRLSRSYPPGKRKENLSGKPQSTAGPGRRELYCRPHSEARGQKGYY